MLVVILVVILALFIWERMTPRAQTAVMILVGSLLLLATLGVACFLYVLMAPKFPVSL